MLNRAHYGKAEKVAHNIWADYNTGNFNSEKFGSTEAAGLAALIIEKNYNDEDFKRILGINFFNDAVWFNKEGFDAALFYSSLFFMIDNTVKIPVEERLNFISGIYEALVKAEEKSEYRFDVLLDVLAQGPSKVKIDNKSGGKKNNAKSTKK